MKKKIVIFTDHFLPCSNSGGPVITVLNLIKIYKNEIDFYIVCLNRDKNSDVEYDFSINEFIDFESYKCMYVKSFSHKLFNFVLTYDFDCIYLLGTYSKYTRYFLFKNKKKIKSKIVIAPMGNFSSGALDIKKLKKLSYYFLLKKLFLSKHIFWSFTSQKELDECVHILGKKIIKNALICPDPVIFKDFSIDKPFMNRSKSIVFISRICEKKGLYESIEKLLMLNCECQLDVYGYIEDASYFEKCIEKAKGTKLTLTYCGELTHEDVFNTFSKYNFFIFTTHGENFGHVIFESLNSGCFPIVPKNVTPWDGVLKEITDKFDFLKDISCVLIKNNCILSNLVEECVSSAKKYYINSKTDFLNLITKYEG